MASTSTSAKRQRHPAGLPAGWRALCRGPLLAAFLGLLLFGAACQPNPTPPPPPEPASEAPAGPPVFEDVTARSGVSFTYRNGEDTADHRSILESLGGGVALLDYDGDGLLDLFLAGGGRYGGADKKSILGLPCRLYRNLGNQRFQDVTTAAGLDHLAGAQPWFYSHGAAVADYDRDGWPDLLVSGWGRIALFHNVPARAEKGSKGRRFEDVTAAAGLDRGITWATSAAFGDIDGDGYPDLYVCQYVNWSFANHPHCSYDGKTREVCPPKSFDGLPHRLYRNTGKGSFEDVSATAGLVAAGRTSSKGLGVLLVDVNGDGKPDIYVTNDTVDKLLYLNRSTPGKIRLEEAGLASGAALDGHGSASGSMGVDAGDYDGSGKPSLWVTNYENELHGLYRNEMRGSRPSFRFLTPAVGLAGMGQRYVGWGTAFLDVDLDGWEDLFVSNGHVVRYQSGGGVGRKQPPVLFHNAGGTFTDMSAQIGSYQRKCYLGRGVGFGDLDNDGRTDLVVSHMNDPAAILCGIGGAGRHWLGVELVGKGHADVVGARLQLRVGDRTLTRFARGGGSYLSANDRRLLFGLGEQLSPGRLTITWPDGQKQHLDGLSADRYHRVVQEKTK